MTSAEGGESSENNSNPVHTSGTLDQRASIRHLLRVAFPRGTQMANDRRRWTCPASPPDVFGFCALLLHWSGAYRFFSPRLDGEADGEGFHFVPEDRYRDAIKLGDEWRTSRRMIESGTHGFVETPARIKEMWQEITRNGAQTLYLDLKPGDSIPEWCINVYLLTIVADQACAGIGRFSESEGGELDKDISWFDEMYSATLERDRQASLKQNAHVADTPHRAVDPDTASPGQSYEHLPIRPRFKTLALRLSQDVACVQPKNKTPAVGCTMRALSHHVSLLPNQGQIRVHWLRPPARDLGDPIREDFNVLLIPYPFKIDAEAFQPQHQTSKSTRKWGWFHLDQTWLPRASSYPRFVETIDRLIQTAEDNAGKIHAVVFPEFALNWDLFKSISGMIAKNHPSVSLLTSGSNSNCYHKHPDGNFVLTSNFYDDSEDEKRRFIATSRPKHHRWQLNRSQIEGYGLDSVLDPDIVWWEHIPIEERELHVNLFREGSAFSTLICEDLARSEPVHEVLKSLGPSLVFVLLMDGPQLSFRWPARYSTGLSDDPGSTVLTLTSKALVNASAEHYRKKHEAEQADPDSSEKQDFQPDYSVALWKDDINSPRSIVCEPGSAAVVCRLKADKVMEASLDGREIENCWSWRMTKGKTATTQVALNAEDSEFLGVT
ncbi:hypothetical protein RMQ97_06245 [Maricaulis sp. D1M11]|uniref:hypothetical protein n=1 Tax=Maricaulis sp. D1M11 TaxID=3076117 RepID=UPI0039B6DC77